MYYILFNILIVISSVFGYAPKSEQSISCLSFSSLNFVAVDLGHAISVHFKDETIFPLSIIPTSWESNNSVTTTLEYDFGGYARFYKLEVDYVEIKVTYLFNDNICQSAHLLYFED